MDKLKNPKTLLKIILVVALIAIIIGVILFVVNKNNSNNNENNENGASNDVDYASMIAKDIEVKYNEENDESTITFVIENRSNNKIEEEIINAILQNEAEQQLGGVQIHLPIIEAKGETTVTTVLSGKLTEVKKIELLKPEEQEVEETVE